MALVGNRGSLVRSPVALAGVAGAAAFAFYALLAVPDAGWGDSGEFSTQAFTLGVAHPTGFPLLGVLGRAAAFVPIGTVAFRVNAMGAALTALAIALGVALARRLGVRLLGAAALAVILGSSALLLRHATSAEAYPLDLALVAGVAFSACLAPSARRDAALGLLCGLGAAHHAAFRIVAIPIGLGLVLQRLREKPWRALWPAVLFLCTALAVVYLPIRASRSPALDWGHPATLGAMLAHLTGARIRAAFASSMLSPAVALDVAPALLGILVRDIGWGVLILAPFAFVSRVGDRGRVLVALGWIAVSTIGYACLLNPMGVRNEQAGLPLEWAAAVAGVLGLDAVAERIERSGTASAIPVVIAGSLLLAAPPVIRAVLSNDLRSPRYEAADFSLAALETLPSRPIVLCVSDDLCGGSLYAQYVAGSRPDALVLPRQHLWDEATLRARLSRHGEDAIEPERLARWLALRPDARRGPQSGGVNFFGALVSGEARPAFVELSSTAELPPRFVDERTAPRSPGILFEVVDEPPAAIAGEVDLDALARSLGMRAPESRRVLAQAILGHAHARIARGEWDAAAADLARALATSEEVSEPVWTALGAIASRQGDFRLAVFLTRRAIERTPERVVPRVNLGRYLLAAGNVRAAERELLAALRRDRSSADAWGALGVALARRGDFGGAARAWQTALELDPAQPEARLNGNRLPHSDDY